MFFLLVTLMGISLNDDVILLRLHIHVMNYIKTDFNNTLAILFS